MNPNCSLILNRNIMNIKRFTLLTASCLILAAGYFSTNQPAKENYFPRESSLFQQRQALADGYLEYMKSIRNNPETGEILYQDISKANRLADKLPNGSKTLDLAWRFKGPDNVGGRTRGVAVDSKDTAHLIVGGVSGGLWESFDAAASWQPYDLNFEIQNVSAITQSSDGTFYVATGAGFDGSNNDKGTRSQFLGTGLYKLTGNGTSELIIGPSSPNTYGVNWTTINEVVADPADANRLLVAMNGGLVEIKLGAGTNGSDEINFLITGNCYDVEIGANQRVTATFVNGVMQYSTDNGANFTRTSFAGAGRIEVAIAPTNSDIQYASAARVAGGCLLAVYRTYDSWQTFTVMPNTPDFFATGFQPGRCQGFYDHEIAVFPNNPNKLLAAGVALVVWNQSSVDPAPLEGEWQSYASTFDGGGVFRNPTYVHADKHKLVFNPQNSNTLYIGSDGGIGVSFNADETRPVFSQGNLGYNVTQFYDISAGPQDLVLGGTQDNGSQLVGLGFNTGRSAVEVFGGDGFDQELFTVNPSLGIASIYYGNISRIQGIGTKLSNSTFDAASILSGNLLNLCGGEGAQLLQCSEVFYTVTSIWESFNHPETKDSARLIFTQTQIPISSGTVLYTESNNSSPSAHPNTSNLNFNLYDIDTTRLLTNDTLRSDLFPVDTLVGTYSSKSRVLEQFVLDTDTLYISLDTIIIDKLAEQVIIRHREGTVEVKSYDVEVPVEWDNVFVKNEDEVTETLSLVIDTVETSPSLIFGVTYREYSVEFLYETEIRDLIQSTVALCNIRSNTSGSDRNVWISKDILKGASVNEPRWVLVADRTSTPDGLPRNSDVLVAEFSPDGNHLFLGTSSSELYRVDGINDIDVSQIDNATQIDFLITSNTVNVHKLEDFKSRLSLGIRGAITGIAIDPNDANNVVVTFGNYGLNNHVARSTNALDPNGANATFATIDQGLPLTPVYDAIIDRRDPNVVIIATELGVYATENGFAPNANDVVWTEENGGLGRVPAVSLEQMTFKWEEGAINEGKIYVGTHGRGIFEADQLVGISESSVIRDNAKAKDKELRIYPNPVSEIVNLEIEVDNKEASLIKLYSISGQLIKEISNLSLTNGKNTIQLDLSELNTGAYIIQYVNGANSKSARLIKQ